LIKGMALLVTREGIVAFLMNGIQWRATGSIQ
jgi:hypothetical protein